MHRETARTLSTNEGSTEAKSFRYVPRSLLIILRAHLGVILLITVAGKVFRSEPFSVEMLTYLQKYSLRVASGPYKHFLESVVIPHVVLFSHLIVIAEIIAGISLLFGLATRLGATIAMFLFLNYMFSKGRLFWSPDSEDAAVFFSALVCLLGAAGRVWGIDAYLAKRWRRIPLW